jgi:hypothetical protein
MMIEEDPDELDVPEAKKKRSVKPETHIHADAEKTPDAIGHKCRSWEKTCPGCGAPNPDYVAPDLFCESCSVPTGNLPEGFEAPGFSSDPVELPAIPPCWNCGCTRMVYRKPENGLFE